MACQLDYVSKQLDKRKSFKNNSDIQKAGTNQRKQAQEQRMRNNRNNRRERQQPTDSSL